MNKKNEKSIELAAHLFRVEYGKIVSVLVKFTGVDKLNIAEDIAQETFFKAVNSWQHDGVPKNPKAWLYLTAKNECLNVLKKKSLFRKYEDQLSNFKLPIIEIDEIDFSENTISDGQLKMMFVCCNPSISKAAQLGLILKILAGFSISEIANAFFTSKETINKRLVRARKRLRDNEISFSLPTNYEKEIPTILQAIYLLFTEGYLPSQKDELLRRDLCFEAIRLAEILKNNHKVKDKHDCYALLSLMYLNASRFEARLQDSDCLIEMKNQDRNLWNRELINIGIEYLNKGTESESVSIYQILAAISANHCIAPAFEDTNWEEILKLYNSLLLVEDGPIIRLNRSVALSMVKGNKIAIDELLKLKEKTDIDKYHLFHSTLAEFYLKDDDIEAATSSLKNAISHTNNQRDIAFIEKKLSQIVPV